MNTAKIMRSAAIVSAERTTIALCKNEILGPVSVRRETADVANPCGVMVCRWRKDRDGKLRMEWVYGASRHG